MSFTLNEDEVRAILSEVERDLESVLKTESDRLAKGEESSSASASPAIPEESSEGSSASASAGFPGGEESSEGSHSAEGSSPALPGGDLPPGGDAPPMDASAAPAGAAPGADPSAPPMSPSPEGAPAPGAEGQPGGEEDLEAKLSALPEEQLKHLYMAAKQALFARMSAGQPPGAPPAGPSASPGAPPAPAMSPSPSPGMPPPAMKGEMKAHKEANGNVLKSEMEAKLADQQAQIEGLAKAVTMLVSQPLRKAITNLSHMPKPGEGQDAKDVTKLSKAEITAKLSEKTRDPSMSKKDRDAVNGFYDGRFDVSKIAHLLQ